MKQVASQSTGETYDCQREITAAWDFVNNHRIQWHCISIWTQVILHFRLSNHGCFLYSLMGWGILDKASIYFSALVSLEIGTDCDRHILLGNVCWQSLSQKWLQPHLVMRMETATESNIYATAKTSTLSVSYIIVNIKHIWQWASW